jgi:hypothetical protein
LHPDFIFRVLLLLLLFLPIILLFGGIKMTSDNTMPRNKTFTTRKMVTVAMLSAIATVIYYLDFPVPDQ